MDNLKENALQEQYPRFYKEKIKEPQKMPWYHQILKAITGKMGKR